MRVLFPTLVGAVVLIESARRRVCQHVRVRNMVHINLCLTAIECACVRVGTKGHNNKHDNVLPHVPTIVFPDVTVTLIIESA